MKVRFLFKSHADGVTLTATSGTPANMQTGGAARTWRTDGLAGQATAPFGESKNINVIHLENVNFDSPVSVQFSDDDFATVKHVETFSKWAKDLTYAAATHWFTGAAVGGDKVLDANGDAVLDGGGDAVLDATYAGVALPIAAESMRITVDDPDNADGYVEIGRLMVGEYSTMENSPNISVNKSFNYRERSPQIETRGGSWRQMERPPQRQIRLEFEFLHEDDATEIAADSLIEYLRTIGPRSDVLVTIYPAENTDRERLHTVVGRITERSDLRGNFLAVESGVTKLYSRLTFEITESL